MLAFTVIYMAGIFGQTFANGSLSAMYASRFVAGIGIGTTTVIPSIYITEVSCRLDSNNEFVRADPSA